VNGLPAKRRAEFEAFIGHLGVAHQNVSAAHKVAWLQKLLENEPRCYNTLLAYCEGLEAYGPRDEAEIVRHRRILRGFVLERRRANRLPSHTRPLLPMPVTIFRRLLIWCDQQNANRRKKAFINRLRVALLIGWHTGLVHTRLGSVRKGHVRWYKEGFCINYIPPQGGRSIQYAVPRTGEFGQLAYDALKKWLSRGNSGAIAYVMPWIRENGSIDWHKKAPRCFVADHLHYAKGALGESRPTCALGSIREAFIERVNNELGPVAAFYLAGNANPRSFRYFARHRLDWNVRSIDLAGEKGKLATAGATVKASHSSWQSTVGRSRSAGDESVGH